MLLALILGAITTAYSIRRTKRAKPFEGKYYSESGASHSAAAIRSQSRFRAKLFIRRMRKIASVVEIISNISRGESCKSCSGYFKTNPHCIIKVGIIFKKLLNNFIYFLFILMSTMSRTQENKIRTKISNEHLRIAISCVKPDIDELVSKRQAFSVFSLKIFIFF